MMTKLDVDEFLVFVTTLEGKSIRTRAGRSTFTVQVVPEGIVFTPESTGVPRLHRKPYIERVLDAFTRTGSWITTDCRFTVNSAYQLTLIDKYLAAGRKV